MKAGRARWLARLKSEGKPIPFGRKKGGHNRPREEREHDGVRPTMPSRQSAHGQTKCGPIGKRGAREQRQERDDARRRMEEHARRKARADAGLPYWTDEEWENLGAR